MYKLGMQGILKGVVSDCFRRYFCSRFRHQWQVSDRYSEVIGFSVVRFSEVPISAILNSFGASLNFQTANLM